MSDSAEPQNAPDVEEIPPAEIACWRCELLAPSTALKCPHCAAPLTTISATTKSINDDIKALVISFVILLVSGIVHGGIVAYLVGDQEVVDESLRRELLLETLFVEVFDAIVIGVVLSARGMKLEQATPSRKRKVFTWILSLPLLTGMLGLNLFYHWLLRSFLHVPLLEDEVTEKVDALLILTYCIQPALIEEAYFRGFALRVLDKASSPSAAVLISSVMFGMVHLASPFSIPYLVCMGLFLGYVRLSSGTIWLPILLHFIHNLLVIFI